VAGKICRGLLTLLGLLGCLTLGFLGCPTAAHAASPVWAIRGEHNTVYLAGSVHLLKAQDSALPAAFDHAYTSAKGLVMELDMDNLDPSAAAGWMLENGMNADGQGLEAIVGSARYQQIATEAKRLGMAKELLDQFAPWVVGMELIELQYAQLGYDANSGVEMQLDQRAKVDGKPIRGLETLEEQLGFLGSMSMPDQLKFLDMTIAELHDTNGDTQSVVTAWRNGDAGKLSALLSDEYKSFPALYRLLVSDRNRRWVPQIEKLLKEPQNYFVVVGALHLVGDGGLLELMRRDGFKAEQLN
jgi:hypothetical protein